MNTQLLIIDPQNDFCDLPNAALPVAGAHQDMLRLSRFIDQRGRKFSQIHVSLDSHHLLDIAHPAWWVDAQGRHPAPFTVISEQDVLHGVWRAADMTVQARSVQYVQALARAERYALVIWPAHCLIGTWGHNIHNELMQSLNQWSVEMLRQVNFVYKGSNPFTEHYSAVQAEVPDADDEHTQVNSPLLAALRQADEIVVAGEALSHCVANTISDLVAQLGDDSAKKFVLLRDCTSSVSGFEALGNMFLERMCAKGMRVVSASDQIW